MIVYCLASAYGEVMSNRLFACLLRTEKRRGTHCLQSTYGEVSCTRLPSEYSAMTRNRLSAFIVQRRLVTDFLASQQARVYDDEISACSPQRKVGRHIF